MNIESRRPDLVERAAARLARLTESDAAQQSGTSAPTHAPVTQLATAERRGPPTGRVVNISPATLAANHIAMPSAGLGRTVEEFRIIKRQILANASQVNTAAGVHLNRTVMITSAKPGDGKTYTAINLALSIAVERDLKVLLVDADVYRQSMMAYLGLSSEIGWVDYVSGSGADFSDVLLHTNIPNLSILPAGTGQHVEIPELMSSRMMTSFVQEMAARYADRFIIFDALPCLASSEPAILASLVGQTLFVVSANETSRDELDSSLRLISACPSVSLILNKAEPLLNQEFGKYGYAYEYRK